MIDMSLVDSDNYEEDEEIDASLSVLVEEFFDELDQLSDLLSPMEDYYVR